MNVLRVARTKVDAEVVRKKDAVNGVRAPTFFSGEENVSTTY